MGPAEPKWCEPRCMPAWVGSHLMEVPQARLSISTILGESWTVNGCCLGAQRPQASLRQTNGRVDRWGVLSET